MKIDQSAFLKNVVQCFLWHCAREKITPSSSFGLGVHYVKGLYLLFIRSCKKERKKHAHMLEFGTFKLDKLGAVHHWQRNVGLCAENQMVAQVKRRCLQSSCCRNR